MSFVSNQHPHQRPPVTGANAADDLHPDLIPSLQARPLFFLLLLLLLRVLIHLLLSPGSRPGLQLLPHGHPPGLAQPDPRPLGVPAAPGDPAAQVLHGGQRHVQLLHRETQREPGGPDRPPQGRLAGGGLPPEAADGIDGPLWFIVYIEAEETGRDPGLWHGSDRIGFPAH